MSVVSQYNERYSPLAAGKTRVRACGPLSWPGSPAAPDLLQVGEPHRLWAASAAAEAWWVLGWAPWTLCWSPPPMLHVVAQLQVQFQQLKVIRAILSCGPFRLWYEAFAHHLVDEVDQPAL